MFKELSRQRDVYRAQHAKRCLQGLASKEAHQLKKRKVRYHFYNDLSLLCIISQIISVHILKINRQSNFFHRLFSLFKPHFFKFQLNIRTSLCIFKRPLHLVFRTKTWYIFFLQVAPIIFRSDLITLFAEVLHKYRDTNHTI